MIVARLHRFRPRGGRRILKCSFKKLNTRVAFSGDVSLVFVHPVVHFCRWKSEWTGVREKKNGKMTTGGGGSVVTQRRGEEREERRGSRDGIIRVYTFAIPPGKDPFSLRPAARPGQARQGA